MYRLFDNLFYYYQQTGQSVVSSATIQICFSESDKQNCSITSINTSLMRGIDDTISLPTVDLKNGLTDGVIKLTSSDS